MATSKRQMLEQPGTSARGSFTNLDGERYYAIENVDRMRDFFVSVVSHDNHWLFVSSNGALTAGRVSPDTALFPYTTVDKIHDSAGTTGAATLIRTRRNGQVVTWEPFSPIRGTDATTRTIYKNTLGNKICFEAVHHDLSLRFRYTWMFSSEHGFVRQCELANIGKQDIDAEVLDGLLNLLPAGTPRFAQTNTSNLVDAYKWTELDETCGLAYYTLYSAITDRAEPCESLRANSCYALGLDSPTIALSALQIETFRQGEDIVQESLTRGQRGAYLTQVTHKLAAGQTTVWHIIADVEKDQGDIVALQQSLSDPITLTRQISQSIADGSDALARLMASSDALQTTNEENVSVHHYANVLFNVLRGGVFDHHYRISKQYLTHAITNFDRGLADKHAGWLASLPDELSLGDMLDAAGSTGDRQLVRLCREYLPIRFGRRHGDPSRPWNLFAIELEDDRGENLLAYQGNWRDVFQNWEGLALSFPGFTESMIAKFVNASTIDGYNPYRITSDGIDWEVEEPDDPWSYIGYWGDHQIIYLQKLLEHSRRFHPEQLAGLLEERIFCYANVPYRIKDFAAIVEDPKNTVIFDESVAARIDARVAARGADGKLFWDANEDVYLVSLAEKLLVPLLAKLGNLVVDGGIWLNTQRPEWNDANNALVGNGLSMVTTYYLRRYVVFLTELIASLSDETTVSAPLAAWLDETKQAIAACRAAIQTDEVDSKRAELLSMLGDAAARYRERVYADQPFDTEARIRCDDISTLLDDTLAVIDRCIEVNKRDDGMYHAYNLLRRDNDAVDIDYLYPMLEGQVAALSAGAIAPSEAIDIIESLFASPIYRADQHTFMLYPDRQLPKFLARNAIAPDALPTSNAITEMLENGDQRLIYRDSAGVYRFNADLENVSALHRRFDELIADYGTELESQRDAFAACYEAVFNHRAFTGRSGTMFGFEGLGCVYWHMVSKLLLAVQENYWRAVDQGEDARVIQRLGELYYDVRAGIGFNKTPAEYGAFPTDPYSHTSGDGLARQPGMTGQVKEELLTRIGELGVRVTGGAMRFEPALLRRREFSIEATSFRYLDTQDQWQTVALNKGMLAFTICQVPVLYRLVEGQSELTIRMIDGSTTQIAGATLDVQHSGAIFNRTGEVAAIEVSIDRTSLFG
ncbi:MAG: hypothetical protein AAAFM81_00385 [Pseudomonadota bacterium]